MLIFRDMEKEEKENDKSLYEVGFHLLPTLTEEEANSESSQITKIISQNKCVIKNTFNPQMRELAYEMSKAVSGKKQKFANAYFGQVVFEADPKTILNIRKAIEAKQNILRTLFIEVPSESLLPRERRVPQVSREEPKADNPEKIEEVIPPMSEAELDKTIEALVIE